MSVYISRSAKYCHIVRSGTSGLTTDSNGVQTYLDHRNGLEAQFKQGILTMEERLLAEQMFANYSSTPYGATPYRSDGMVDPREALADGDNSTIFLGYEPWQSFSRFDTNDPTMCDPEHQELYESVLDSSPDLKGGWFVKLDGATLPAPWPSYPAGPGKAAEIAAFVKNGGFPVANVILYEEANEDRDDVIAKLEAMKVEQDKLVEERKGMTVTV